MGAGTDGTCAACAVWPAWGCTFASSPRSHPCCERHRCSRDSWGYRWSNRAAHARRLPRVSTAAPSRQQPVEAGLFSTGVSVCCRCGVSFWWGIICVHVCAYACVYVCMCVCAVCVTLCLYVWGVLSNHLQHLTINPRTSTTSPTPPLCSLIFSISCC